MVYLLSLVSLLISCAIGGGSSRVYRNHRGCGPRWGDRVYDRDRIIFVPRDLALTIEATAPAL